MNIYVRINLDDPTDTSLEDEAGSDVDLPDDTMIEMHGRFLLIGPFEVWEQ
jgi:hypothetical protein